jgi:hypothetical protein
MARYKVLQTTIVGDVLVEPLDKDGNPTFVELSGPVSADTFEPVDEEGAANLVTAGTPALTVAGDSQALIDAANAAAAEAATAKIVAEDEAARLRGEVEALREQVAALTPAKKGA